MSEKNDNCASIWETLVTMLAGAGVAAIVFLVWSSCSHTDKELVERSEKAAWEAKVAANQAKMYAECIMHYQSCK